MTSLKCLQSEYLHNISTGEIKTVTLFMITYCMNSYLSIKNVMIEFNYRKELMYKKKQIQKTQIQESVCLLFLVKKSFKT